jgi:hypothetical protein
LQRAEHAAQLLARVGGFTDQLVQGFAAEKSSRQHCRTSYGTGLAADIPESKFHPRSEGKQNRKVVEAI